MKLTITALALGLVSSPLLATEASITDHYKMVEYKTPYTVEVCEQKPAAQGAIEGALIGGLLGGALGNDDTAKHLGIFGALVGANESQYQTVCKNETRYNTEMRTVYSHSTISFSYEGRMYTESFQK